MKKSLRLLICILPLLAMTIGCTDFADQAQDDQPDLGGLYAPPAELQSTTSQVTVNAFYDFKTLINFESDTTTWKEIVKKAKKESKPILFYGWATWCQPCQYENATVLGKDASLAHYLNDNFINTRYMMETNTGVHVSAGWDIIDKLGVAATAYPIFLFFDSKGKLVYEHLGPTSSEDLLTMAQAASLLKNKDKIN